MEDPDGLPRDMRALIRLHNARWASSRTRAFGGARHAFHLEWAAEALRRGWLRLWMMEVAGTPIAAWYGFRFGHTAWYYQAGRDPSWGRESVGFVLMCHSVKQAIRDGATEYQLLRGAEPYKDRFASHAQRLDTLALGNPTATRVVSTAAQVARSLPVGVKNRLFSAIG